MARSSAGESSLKRAVRILEAFNEGDRDLSASEIAHRIEMPTSTTHRLLSELVDLGLLERLATKRYRIGLHMWELAVRTPGAVGIREIAHPILRKALANLGQHVQLTILRDGEILYLDRLSSPRSVINLSIVGGRMPFNATSSGLVLAAFEREEVREQLLSRPVGPYRNTPRLSRKELIETLGRVKADGFAVTEGYIEPEATAIAVPVFNPWGDVVAAISAVVPTADYNQGAILNVLLPTSRAVTTALKNRYSGD